jgi:hypothetical protein
MVDDQIFECTIQQKSCVAIEFPGCVRSVHRAEAMLGGISSIATALESKGKVMRVSYRPEDPSAGGIIGEAATTSG